METNRPVYVVDADILRERGVIQLDFSDRREKFEVELDNAHLVIPEVVIRRLSELGEPDGKDSIPRSVVAPYLLGRLRDLTEDSRTFSMRATYRLKAAIKTEESNQLISVLPVQKELFRCLPFCLSESNMDDQVIATVITASLALSSSNANGEIDKKTVISNTFDNVTLLTNNNALAVRAHWYGIKTSRCEQMS